MATAINSSSIKHPNTFSISQGKTLLVTEINAINQSIGLILSTAKGELFGDPNFGCNLYKYIYDYEGSTLENLIKDEIVSSLNDQEPRIFVDKENISISYEGTNVIINISYNLRYTDYHSDYRYITSIMKEE